MQSAEAVASDSGGRDTVGDAPPDRKSDSGAGRWLQGWNRENVTDQWSSKEFLLLLASRCVWLSRRGNV